MREYRVWRKDEERSLRKGVTKHGTGAWEMIRTDPEFADTLKDRTGVQLKDKWRNLVKFNHLTDEEMKASCGGSARTRSGLRQRQALAQAHGSLSPRSRGPRTAARRVDSGSVSAPPLIDTLLMTAAEQEALLRELQAQRALLAVASASSAATHAADGAATAADISTPKDALEAVDAVIEAVTDGLRVSGGLQLPQRAVQQCPPQVAAIVCRHLPSGGIHLLSGSPREPLMASPERTPPNLHLLDSKVMAGAAKAAKAALERVVATGGLGSAPASAAAASLSPLQSPQHSGELQRKRSRELTAMDDAKTNTASLDGDLGDRKVRPAPTIVTTGDLVNPPAAAATRGRPLVGRAVRPSMPHRRRHSISRLNGSLSARDLMVAGMRDSGKRSGLPLHDASRMDSRMEGVDSASEHSAGYVEDDFLQSLYRNCFSKHSDAGDALLYASAPCPPSPTWGGQPTFAAPMRASAPQLPIGASSPIPAASFLQAPASTSAASPVRRPGSVPPMLSLWPSSSLGATSTPAASPPLSGSSAATVTTANVRTSATGMYPTSGHGHSYPAPSTGVSHPSSVSSFVAPDASPQSFKGTLHKSHSSMSGASYVPMEAAPPLQPQPYPPSMPHTGSLEKLLGWGPQHAPQLLSSNSRYPCMRTSAGPPMSTTGYMSDMWSLQTMGSAMWDGKAVGGGCVPPTSPRGGRSEGSASAVGSAPGSVNVGGHTPAFADMTDAYGASLFPRADFQGVLDSLNELDSCCERATPEGDEMFPSCRSTMSFV